MKRIGEMYIRIARVLLAVFLLGMVVLVFGNVVLRYAFNSGLTVSEELSRIFFVWIIFLGATVALAEHGHIGIDFVLKSMPRPVAKAMAVLGSLVVLGCCMLMLSGSYTQSVINLTVVTPVLGLSMVVYYGAGLLFAVVAIIIVLADIRRVLADRPVTALAGATDPDTGCSSPASGNPVQ
jgi:TRAP-type C4-dicarboxylate transport system permease small subunit